jgi:hypothetical protein
VLYCEAAEVRVCGGMALQGTKALEAWCRRVTQAFLRIRLYFSNSDPELTAYKIIGSKQVDRSGIFGSVRLESVGFGFDVNEKSFRSVSGSEPGTTINKKKAAYSSSFNT